MRYVGLITWKATRSFVSAYVQEGTEALGANVSEAGIDTLPLLLLRNSNDTSNKVDI